MQFFKNINLVFVFSLISILTFTNVVADESINAQNEESSQEVEEILVTANRTEQSINDVSQAVQALSGDDLRSSNN